MKHAYVLAAPENAREVQQVREQLLERGVTVADAEKLSAGGRSKRFSHPQPGRGDYLLVLVSPELLSFPAAIERLKQMLADGSFSGRIVAAMIRPTLVLPWCFRKLPMFTLWDDRTTGIEHLVHAIKASRRKAAG
jgi:hypothetical protein